MNFKELKKLVAKNQFEKLDQELDTIIPDEESELKNQLYNVEGSYEALQRKEMLGLLSNSESNQERNKIANLSVMLIDAVKKKLT